ncbi:MAG: putative penicillin-binding protein [Ilumatobacteraceae bacterium]|nr:putative penicillin-binding protein [Ilumatobacteraceae bacterium]
MRPIAWILRLSAIVLAGALLMTAVVVSAAPRLWAVANAHDQVPVTLPPFEPLSQRTYVYDVVGNVIAVFERENSQPIALSDVPSSVVAAILAVEDNEFWQHKGVNVRSLIRATMSNFASDAPRQGASTITQQVVKNEFLANLERDGRYKFLQVHYATMLEKEMTKDQILERYLNTIFFGNNAYGLQAAAEVYFGKNASELTMIEGAFLAGLIRSPSGYDPIRRLERSRGRFKQVTERLADVGMLTKTGAEALAETWPIPEQLKAIPTFDTKPTYYTEAIREYLLERSNILGDDEQARANLLYRGGLRIHTTLDPVLQADAETARTALPANQAGIDTAIVSLDSKTGAIRAMVGGSGFVPRVNELNMALVPRQTGSSIKLFILAAAIQAGAQPDDVIDGKKGCLLPNPGDPKNPFLISSGVDGQLGPLEQATWLSLNCAFARLSQIVGLNRVVDTVYRMAHSPYLYRGQPEEDRLPVEPYASFATGANEMSPLDMASGAQTLANNGLHHDPYYVDWIEHADGTRLYTHEDPGVQVVDEGTALTTTTVLKGVLKTGTAHRELSDFPYPAAGKTGTQQDNTNSWFVGYTPALSTAVWVGDPDGYTPMTAKNVPEFQADGVDAVQGGTYPARIWKAYALPALATLPVEDWAAPPPPLRKASRLYLPGEECAYKVVSGTVSANGTITPPSATTTTTPTPTETTVAPTGSTTPGDPNSSSSVPATVAPVVIQLLPDQTTIAPSDLDPLAPLPTVDAKTAVLPCAKLPAGVIVSKPKS